MQQALTISLEDTEALRQEKASSLFSECTRRTFTTNAWLAHGRAAKWIFKEGIGKT
jgi:hypothetical protein